MEEDASMIEQAEKKYDTRKVEFKVLPSKNGYHRITMLPIVLCIP
jgi:hypothetical protein